MSGTLPRFEGINGDPGNFYHHSSLAYTAYNSLFAAQNRDVFLRGKARADRKELAHRHFRRSQELRLEYSIALKNAPRFGCRGE